MIHTSTPSTNRRQRRRAERAEALLDAAMAIAVSDGIDALTMPRLAEAADVAVGSLYRSFRSKEALVGALQVRALDDLASFLEERLARARGPLRRVRIAFATWAAWAERSPALHGLVDGALSDPRALLDDATAREVDRAMRPIVHRCATLLTEAVAAGDLGPGDSEQRALALWAALRGTLHLRKRDRLLPRRLHADRLAAVVVDGMLAGWAVGAAPAPVTSAAARRSPK